jgi:hypothetical protein
MPSYSKAAALAARATALKMDADMEVLPASRTAGREHRESDSYRAGILAENGCGTPVLPSAQAIHTVLPTNGA